MSDLIEKELSYKVMGAMFNVYNDLGGGYQEKYYQRAIAKELQSLGIKFIEQVSAPLQFKGYSIGRYLLDFLIEGRIVLEIKANQSFKYRDIQQVLAYLKTTNVLLGILVNFSRDGLQSKRILRGND